MSSQALNKLRDEALDLPEPERAELAHDLVSSLDGPADEETSQAWEAELTRRLGAIDSGAAGLVSREEFDRRMRDRLRRL